MDNPASINDQELIIDLDKLNSTQSLGAEEYIRKDIIKDIVDKIDRTVKSNIDNIGRRGTSFNSASLPIAQHPCFFIHGERGSGKSTLLHGVIDALNNENRFGFTRSNAKKIELLTYVDPTEFAKGENFFIYILSKIADRLNMHKKSSSTYDDDDPYSYQDKRKEKHKKIIEIFQDMAEGLKFIQDTNENLHKSEDAAFFFEDYVSKCSSSAQLKQKFAKLLEKMCELEHVDAYIVAIDDADINFGKCSEIMETVRNYMIAPRLVILFAGDMKLYSLVARDTHIERFSPTSLQHDTSRTTHRNTLLEQLEDQYLLKLFPVNGRAYLGSFYELLQSHGSDSRIVTLKHPRFADASVQLQDFLNACMKVLVSDNTEQVIQTFLASQPMRSMLQLLNLWANTLTLGITGKKKITISNDKENISHLTRALSMAFSQALIQHRVDFTLIAQGDYGSLIKNVLLHVARLGGKLSHTRLLADAGDESERKVSFYLNAEVLHNTTSYSRLLKYMFYVFPLIQFINNEDLKNADKQSNKVNEIDDIERFVLNSYYSSYGDKYDEWGAWCTALLAPNPDSSSQTAKRYGTGAIRVMKEGLDNKYISIQSYVKDLCKSSTNPIYTYAIYSSLCTATNDSGIGYYLSIYNLIALITCILDIRDSSDDEITKKLETILTPKDSFPSYVRPSLNDSNSDNKQASKKGAKADSDASEDGADGIHTTFKTYFSDAKKLNVVIREIKKWHNKYKNKSIICHPFAMAQFWARFQAKCKNTTEDYLMNTSSDEQFAKAGKLLTEYMHNLTEALNEELKEVGNECKKPMLASCIESFPLWQVIIANKEHTQLDNIYIGAGKKVNPGQIALIQTLSLYSSLSNKITCCLKYYDAVCSLVSSLEKYINTSLYAKIPKEAESKFKKSVQAIRQALNVVKGEVNIASNLQIACDAKVKTQKLNSEDIDNIKSSISRLGGQISNVKNVSTETLEINNLTSKIMAKRHSTINKKLSNIHIALNALKDVGI